MEIPFILFIFIYIIQKIKCNSFSNCIYSNCLECRTCSYSLSCKCIWFNGYCQYSRNNEYSNFINIENEFSKCLNDYYYTNSPSCGKLKYYKKDDDDDEDYYDDDDDYYDYDDYYDDDYDDDHDDIKYIKLKMGPIYSDQLYCHYTFYPNKILNKIKLNTYLTTSKNIFNNNIYAYYTINGESNTIRGKNDIKSSLTYKNVYEINLYIGIFYPFNKQPVFFEIDLGNKSKKNGLIIFILILLILIVIIIAILIICFIIKRKKQLAPLEYMNRNIENRNRNENNNNNNNIIMNPQLNSFPKVDVTINSILNNPEYLGPRLCQKEYEMYNNECTICLEKFQVNIDEVSVTPCGHLFHHHCISDYLKKNFSTAKCPNCNCDITHFKKNKY